MGEVKQINIKNRTCYFYNDMIIIKNFEARLLKIDKKIIQRHWHLQYWVYHKEKNWWLWKYLWCKSFVFKYWSWKLIYWRKDLNPLYLSNNSASGYIKEKGVNKYLVFDSADENKELLKNIMMFGMELRTKSKK